ncbi:thiamine pyrophosphate-binding protein [Dactylosporangium sp. NPDC051485]|uniref:thiamine pyrophosphate-binding protein n=1 Tax=Dactylosporangium sp. NPDC051485 TaxID=3154846 RepID=UPI00343589A4
MAVIQRTLADNIFDAIESNGDTPEEAVLRAFRKPTGDLDVLQCACLLAAGRPPARAAVERTLRRLEPTASEASLGARADAVVDRLSDPDILLTAGELVGVLLAASGVERVFGYAGTSELPLCDAIEEIPGITLTNGRGDKESAFMAAGASLIRPNTGAAILHGARGLTNAAGALADARRNEVGTVFIVGLASTGSSQFLPPHNEPDLLETLGAFARWNWEAPAVPIDAGERVTAAATLAGKLREAIATAARKPWGPVLFGIPQDVSEARWVPLSVLDEATPQVDDGLELDAGVMGILRASRRPVILIDDYALRSEGIRTALDRFSRLLGAAVVQLRYRRGLMLFERLQFGEVEHFAGWLNQYSSAHRAMLDECDLFITVEDRNIYQRVVGNLPTCRKIAITTDTAKVLKNEYLSDDDLMVEGDPTAVLTAFADALDTRGGTDVPLPWSLAELRTQSTIGPEQATRNVQEARHRIVRAISDLLGSWSRPVMVDDSSMFGGLVCEHYDELPGGLRVFGGHGGFVGAGLGYAVGLALGEPSAQVLCILGDQAFTNSYQALVAAVDERADFVILVCNNGESVSLKKQAVASYGDIPRRYLDNAPQFRYSEVAGALGVHTERVAVSVGEQLDVVDEAVAELTAALRRASAVRGPALVELVLPADPSAWRGIWVVHGFEQQAPVSVG